MYAVPLLSISFILFVSLLVYLTNEKRRLRDIKKAMREFDESEIYK